MYEYINNRPVRFIPARAGNILIDNIIQNTVTVHPRACGEHMGDYVEVEIDNGSSPRVRGTYNLTV